MCFLPSDVLSQVILALGDYMSVQVHCCIGGVSIGEDIRKLDYGQHVVSGTPGRVFGILYYVSVYKESWVFLGNLLSFEHMKIKGSVCSFLAGLEIVKKQNAQVGNKQFIAQFLLQLVKIISQKKIGIQFTYPLELKSCSLD